MNDEMIQKIIAANEMLDAQPIPTQWRTWMDEDGVIHEWSGEKP